MHTVFWFCRLLVRKLLILIPGWDREELRPFSLTEIGKDESLYETPGQKNTIASSENRQLRELSQETLVKYAHVWSSHIAEYRSTG